MPRLQISKVAKKPRKTKSALLEVQLYFHPPTKESLQVKLLGIECTIDVDKNVSKTACLRSEIKVSLG